MRKIVSIAIILLVAAPLRGQTEVLVGPEKPRLVVSIVIGGMPHDLLEKFSGRLSSDGLGRFMTGGVRFSAAHYDYMQTLSPTGLATITTGVNPLMHGVVAGAWIDYVTGERVGLVDDSGVTGLGTDWGRERYSPLHIVMPTLGDKLLAESPASRVISIASDPVSAIVAGGQSGTAYWMDSQRAVWVSSTAYMSALPEWVEEANATRGNNRPNDRLWVPSRSAQTYINGTGGRVFGETGGSESEGYSRPRGSTDYGSMLRTPWGNSRVAEFARQAVLSEGLGTDAATDLLYVTFDASRTIAQTFGVGSMEVEDALYRLDVDLAVLIRSISMAVGGDSNVLFVLTSDHGMSGAWDAGLTPESRVERDRFNAAQFKAILNSFLGVQFGAGEWVLDYIDRQLYLNRNLVYQKSLNLEDVQNRAAAFVLQFRGVSHVLSSTALAGGYFGSGYGLRMQNSFYPRRGGDLMLNLMPGWIEQREGTRSLPGSMYDYDTHVPLMMLGWRIPPGTEVATPSDMTRLAPTLARILGIGRLTASEGETLPIF
jgi:predicted AlkP superfamily pyrophosphatase or phosphodiesterase